MRKNFYKKPSESIVVKTEVVCPNDSNPMGILKGGRLVEWMDMAAAVCAQTHARRICVTASVNQVDFHSPAKVGDMINIIARITRSFNTSMEIFVQAFASKVPEEKKYIVSEAYFTFVALDENGKTTGVIAVKPVTPSEKKQFHAALYRKKNRNRQIKKRLL